MAVKRTIKSIIFVFVLALMAGVLVCPIESMAQDAKTGLKTTADNAGMKDIADKVEAGDITVARVIGKTINIVLSFLGVIFLILMIYGGLLWMTAAGNEEQVGKAKSIIVSATVGIALVLSAYAITHFVVDKILYDTMTPIGEMEYVEP